MHIVDPINPYYFPQNQESVGLTLGWKTVWWRRQNFIYIRARSIPLATQASSVSRGMKLRKNLLAQEGDTSDEELQLAISTCSDRGEGSQEKMVYLE